MNPILKSIEHLLAKGIDVSSVKYDNDMRWHYYDADGNLPEFDGKDIDLDILEDAADYAYEHGITEFSI